MAAPISIAGFALAALVVAGGRGRSRPEEELPKEVSVDFAREVRPVLAQACFGCHGPDEATREADLRLDTHDGMFAEHGEFAPVVPGDLDASELWRRVTDPLDPMPPLTSEVQLAPEQREVLRRWIEAGAPWQRHWAFEPPALTEPPVVVADVWVRDPLDAYVRARQEALGLEPAGEARRHEYLRRVSFDLIGLPPTTAELDAFLADPRPDAYERVVDRLLASPRYGERQAQDWLDLARYADSNGDGFDAKRDMWRWREWVVRAFNANQSFDQFTIEQLAGDLLPSATREQRLATGFQRNHTLFTKGGAGEDEYRHAYVVDRVNTLSTVWMGLTLGCAQCHDHKFDPLSQREYYQLYDAFNDVSERDVGRTRRPSPPFLYAPGPAESERLSAVDARVAELEGLLEAERADWDAAQTSWERERRVDLGAAVEWEPLEPHALLSLGGARLEQLEDGSIAAQGANPGADTYLLVASPGRRKITGLRLEVLPEAGVEGGRVGRSEHGRFSLTDLRVFVGTIAQGSGGDKVRFARGEDDVRAESFVDADKAVDADDESSWMLVGDEVEGAHAAVFVVSEPLELNDNAVLRLELEHKFGRFYRQNLARFRVSITDDERILRRRLPVLPSAWHSLGPFPADDAADALARDFGREGELGPRLDLKRAKYAAPLAPKEKAAEEPKGRDSRRSTDDEDKQGKPGELRWKEQLDWRDAAELKLAGKHAAWYLHRTLEVDRERELRVHFRGVRGLRAWVDGVEVHERGVLAEEDEPDFISAFEDFGDVNFDDAESYERWVRLAPRYESFTLVLAPGEHQLVLKLVTGEKGARPNLKLEARGRDVLPVALERALRSKDEASRAALRRWYRRLVDPEGAALQSELERLALEKRRIEAYAPTVMVLDDDAPRETHVLVRGAWDQPGELVEFGVPAVLPPLAPELPADRLGLARWLVSGEHPLTARVTVNRVWQQLFGRGLVESTGDFGTRGALPSHPALLDRLALDFVESGWDVKALQRRLVLSATYRQSAQASAGVRARDPLNRWLTRARRRRLSAEMVRDNALAVSRLLVHEVGGKSVKPYQPKGLWESVGGEFARPYEPDEGRDLYRRGLYVFWKRGVLYPSLATFDAPARATCTTERPETNTPLQALVLLNDPVFVEAARELAARMITDGGADRGSRLALGFRLCTSRLPDERELAVMLRLVDEELAVFTADEKAAIALLEVGDFDLPAGIEPAELAAWTLVASALLNLDATLHRS